MRTYLLGICILLSSALFAQRECATSEYLVQQQLTDPALSGKISIIENFISQESSTSQKILGDEGINIIRIPVVVHLLYSNSVQNISDAQIQGQIDALNRDFRKKNADTLNIPAQFKNRAADVQIEFTLATADPHGRATTGIIRKQTGVTEWRMDDKIKYSSEGGSDAWDSRYYLNIWVGNLRNLLGYSSVPGANAENDGIVMHYKVFGMLDNNGPYSMGRTAVHEVGHWLGLKHIWGDTYCGDDLVHDTPKQGNFTTGCPTAFRSSCSNGTDGDMYMNFMDYTNDACMSLFTKGQKQRMLSLFNPGGPRYSLLASKGLDAPWNFEPLPVEETYPVELEIKYYPNPVINELVIDLGINEKWIGKTLLVINNQGIVVSRVHIKSTIQKINVSGLKKGLYFLNGKEGEMVLNKKFIKL